MTGFALIALIALVVASGLWLANARPASPLAEDQDNEIVSAIPTKTTFDGRSVVDVDIEWSSGDEIPWTAGTGVVREVFVADGSSVASFAPVALVDERTVWAIATDRPLYRDIPNWTRGSDVDDLARAMIAAGLVDDFELDGRVSSEMREAIRELNAVDDRDSSTLELASVQWIPTQSVTVGTVETSAGSPAPAEGDPIFVGAPAIESAQIAEPDGESASLPILSLSNVVIELSDGSELAVDSNGSIDEAGLTVLAGLVPLSLDVLKGVTIRLDEPQTAFRVPASALILDPTGPTCVVLEDTNATVLVVVQEGGPGYVDLQVDDLNGPVRIFGDGRTRPTEC